MPQLSAERKAKSAYFLGFSQTLRFVPSGCTLLDCVLSGGWPLGRISNVVGDKSTGKTLLAVEACANMVHKYPKGQVWYREAESAFDRSYAQTLGMPVDRVRFWEDDHKDSQPFATVEDFFDDLNKRLDILEAKNQPGLYILDSLDALSDREEMEREIDKGSYGANKAKKMSELFRRTVRRIEKSNLHLMVISQVRDKMNAMAFGKKHTRSGGRALDFYASQVLYLTHLKTHKKTVRGIKRPYGIQIGAKCEKNKIGLPLRNCTFDIIFSFGIDDVAASLDWLHEVKKLHEFGIDDANGYEDKLQAASDADFQTETKVLRDHVIKAWYDIEKSFLPTNRRRPMY